MIFDSGLCNDVNDTTMFLTVIEFVPEPSPFVLLGMTGCLLDGLDARRRAGRTWTFDTAAQRRKRRFSAPAASCG